MKPVIISDLVTLKAELPMLKSFTDFDLFAPSLMVTENYARTYILGEEVYSLLEQESGLHRSLRGYIAHFGVASVLPQLDVNISQMGISVLNNDNSAPASTQRVKALEHQLMNSAFNHLEQIDGILLLEYPEVFLRSSASRRITDSIIYDAKEMELVYYPDRNINRYNNYLIYGKKAMHFANTILAGAISAPVLVATIKNAYTTPKEPIREVFRHHLLDVLSAIFTGDIPMRNRLLTKVIAFVVDNLGHFPEFIGTPEYKKVTSPIYENKADNPGFWGV